MRKLSLKGRPSIRIRVSADLGVFPCLTSPNGPSNLEFLICDTSVILGFDEFMNYAAKASPSGRDILSLSGDGGFHHSIFYQGESVFRVTQFDNFLFPWHVAELIGREFGSGQAASVGSKAFASGWDEVFVPKASRASHALRLLIPYEGSAPDHPKIEPPAVGNRRSRNVGLPSCLEGSQPS